MFIEEDLLYITLNNIIILLINMLEMCEIRFFFIIEDSARKNAWKAEISQLMFRNLKWNATISGSRRPSDVITLRKFGLRSHNYLGYTKMQLLLFSISFVDVPPTLQFYAMRNEFTMITEYTLTVATRSTKEEPRSFLEDHMTR